MFFQDNGKLDKQPVFHQLKYSDSGFYVCEVSMGMGIKQTRSFQLVVEGMSPCVSVSVCWGGCNSKQNSIKTSVLCPLQFQYSRGNRICFGMIIKTTYRSIIRESCKPKPMCLSTCLDNKI